MIELKLIYVHDSKRGSWRRIDASRNHVVDVLDSFTAPLHSPNGNWGL